jgi:RNA polymerase sigma-70 factor, ECF subfamily
MLSGRLQLDRASLRPPALPPVTAQAPSRSTSDADLLQRLALGDDRALGTFYDRHSAMAYGLARAIVRDTADAEEVVAESFAQIWRGAASFDAARGSAAAWVSTIVRTRALDLIRAQRRRARVMEDPALLTGDMSVAPAPGDTPDREVERGETGALVRRALADLPDAQRRVLELAYFGGMSQSEIAAFLSEPLGTVKTRMRAGMEKLRAVLRPLVGLEAHP